MRKIKHNIKSNRGSPLNERNQEIIRDYFQIPKKIKRRNYPIKAINTQQNVAISPKAKLMVKSQTNSNTHSRQ